MAKGGDELIEHLEIPFSLIIIICYILASFAIARFKEVFGYAPYIHESCISCLLGVVLGGIIKAWGDKSVRFSSVIFFDLVLPPIIFAAGYTLKRRRFFRYLHLVGLFGLLGTTLNVALLTLAIQMFASVFGGNLAGLSWSDSMILAAVLSASDEVSVLSLVRMRDHPRMGALIFGEGIVNDAVSIVLFKALTDWSKGDAGNAKNGLSIVTSLASTIAYQMMASCVIGITLALIVARILFVHGELRQHPVHQTTLVLVFGYLSYFVAEAMGVSGILTIFVCAITMAHYTWHSLSLAAKLATKISFQSLSDVAEAFAFAYVGLSLWAFTSDDFNFPFAIYMLMIIIAGRFATILGIFAVCSLLADRAILPMNEQIGFSIGGLVRGALCWAQVLQIGGGHDVFVTTTLIVVMVTTIGAGFILPVIMPLITAGSFSDKKMSISLSPLPPSSGKEPSSFNSPSSSSVLLASPSPPMISLGKSYQNDSTSYISPEDANNNSLITIKSERTTRPRTSMTPNLYRNTGVDSDDNKKKSMSINKYKADEGGNRTAKTTDTTPLRIGVKMPQPTPKTTVKEALTPLSEGGAESRDLEALHRTCLSPEPHVMSSDKEQLGKIYSILYIFFIHFDEKMMKPLFGGSLADESRLFLLAQTNDMTFAGILCNASRIKELVKVGLDLTVLPSSSSQPQSHAIDGSIEYGREEDSWREGERREGRCIGADDDLLLQDVSELSDINFDRVAFDPQDSGIFRDTLNHHSPNPSHSTSNQPHSSLSPRRSPFFTSPYYSSISPTSYSRMDRGKQETASR